MIRWTGLAPWEFEFSFPGSLTSTFLAESLYACGPFAGRENQFLHTWVHRGQVLPVIGSVVYTLPIHVGERHAVYTLPVAGRSSRS